MTNPKTLFDGIGNRSMGNHINEEDGVNGGIDLLHALPGSGADTASSAMFEKDYGSLI
jgi:hypothetical protein